MRQLSAGAVLGLRAERCLDRCANRPLGTPARPGESNDLGYRKPLIAPDSGIPQNPGQEFGTDILAAMLIWKLDADRSFSHELMPRTFKWAAESQLAQPPDKFMS